MIQLIPGQHIHIVGISGAGLSAIARVLLQQGFYISGSDRLLNDHARALARDGALIFEGHDPRHIEGAEMLIISSAVSASHPEVVAAWARKIPVYKRADIVSSIMSGQLGIAIAGTHGKTTTTAMVTHILHETGQRPSYIIGGVLQSTGQNAAAGAGKAFVIEADEYDNMFHGLRPQIEVITNVEWDHPDFFPTPHDLTRSFSHFVGLLPNDGLLIACADDPTALIYAENRRVVNLPVLTYGIDNPQASWRADQIITTDKQMTAFYVIRDGRHLGMAQLQVPGRHNVLNALAALAVADSQGVPFADAARALATFTGTGRRFELRGERDSVAVIDDYAHHPTAIRAALQAARQRYAGREVWAVWQPHTYSRTQALMDDYATAFEDADHVLVTEIYAAREQPLEGVTSAAVVAQTHHADMRAVASFDEAATILDREVKAPAVVIIMSAGDAPEIGVKFLQRRSQERA